MAASSPAVALPQAQARPAEGAVAETPTQAIAVATDHSAVELRRIRRLLLLTFLMALLTAVYFTRDVLLPIVIAVVLTLTLLPAIRFGERYKVPKGVSAVLVILGMALAFAGFGYVLSGPAQTLAADAPRIAEEVQDKLGGILERLSSIREQANEVTGAAPAADAMIDANGDGVAATPLVVEVAEEQGGLADQIVAGLASAGGALGAALILAVFMLASGDFYHRRIVEAMPRLRDKKQALTIIRDVERQISRYLGAIFLINAALGVAVGVSMWLLGLPLAVVWGLLAFLLNFIPFVGNVLNLVLVAAVSLVSFDTLGQAALPPLVLMGLMLAESNVITPILIGRRLELNTVSQLVMVAFWTWLWGVPGAILAVPFLVVVKAVCDNVESLQTLGSFLSGDPSTHAQEAPQKATTGPALESAPLRTQAEAREESPPGEAPGEGRTLAEAARGAHPLPL
jgi:predicted PurR-regulated permease PerM